VDRKSFAHCPSCGPSKWQRQIQSRRFALMPIKKLGKVFKGAYNEFGEDKVLRLSAALAYYALFSLAPLVIIVIAVAGIFFGEKAVQGQVQEQLRDFFGQQGAQTIESMVKAAHKPTASIIA